jgi:hypothetical protein
VALNCSESPSAIEEFAGVMEIDTRVTAVTVRFAEPFTAPEVAVIVIEPASTPVANPCEPGESLIVATVPSDELQLTVPVMFCVLLSLKVPVAVNCWVVLSGIDAVAGVTAIEISVASLTVNVVEPLTVPEAAEIVTPPTDAPVARPALLIVARDRLLELHVTELVRFCVLLSLNVPIAVNCCVVPVAIVSLAGVTAIEISAAGVTVTEVDPFTVPEAAVIVVTPVATLVATPCVPVALLIVAILGAEELHTAVLVTSCVVPSVNFPVAVNC